MIRGVIIMLLCWVFIPDRGFAQKESGELSYSKFIEYVEQYHPVTVQAGIVAETGALEIQKARGEFDPVISSEISQKQFDDKTYYDLNRHQLKIPTWFGIEGKAGFERNDGVFLNPENSTTTSGLWYAGINVPVGQGLFIDKRRAMLRQAKEYSKASEAERQLMVNNLLLEASNAYWNWYIAAREVSIYTEGVQLAKERLEATKKGARVGDRPTIDTLEANIQWQNRQIRLEQAQLNFNKRTLDLSTFLWWKNNTPLELSESTRPQQETPDVYPGLSAFGYDIDSLNMSHPLLVRQQRQLAVLEIERQLKAEMLKPRLNLSYTPLVQATGDNPLTQYSINNYTWGLNFSIPLLLRQERAELQQTKLKIEAMEQTVYQRSYELFNTARAYLIEVQNLQGQIELYKTNVESYRKLLEAEQKKSAIGESSLFLVNAREVSYLDAQMKLSELTAKQQQALAGLKWAVAKW